MHIEEWRGFLPLSDTATHLWRVFKLVVASLWPVPLRIESVRTFFRPADWQSIQLYLERDLCQPCFSESVKVIPQATD